MRIRTIFRRGGLVTSVCCLATLASCATAPDRTSSHVSTDERLVTDRGTNAAVFLLQAEDRLRGDIDYLLGEQNRGWYASSIDFDWETMELPGWRNRNDPHGAIAILRAAAGADYCDSQHLWHIDSLLTPMPLIYPFDTARWVLSMHALAHARAGDGASAARELATMMNLSRQITRQPNPFTTEHLVARTTLGRLNEVLQTPGVLESMDAPTRAGLLESIAWIEEPDPYRLAAAVLASAKRTHVQLDRALGYIDHADGAPSLRDLDDLLDSPDGAAEEDLARARAITTIFIDQRKLDEIAEMTEGEQQAALDGYIAYHEVMTREAVAEGDAMGELALMPRQSLNERFGDALTDYIEFSPRRAGLRLNILRVREEAKLTVDLLTRGVTPR